MHRKSFSHLLAAKKADVDPNLSLPPPPAETAARIHIPAAPKVMNRGPSQGGGASGKQPRAAAVAQSSGAGGSGGRGRHSVGHAAPFQHSQSDENAYAVYRAPPLGRGAPHGQRMASEVQAEDAPGVVDGFRHCHLRVVGVPELAKHPVKCLVGTWTGGRFESEEGGRDYKSVWRRCFGELGPFVGDIFKAKWKVAAEDEADPGKPISATVTLEWLPRMNIATKVTVLLAAGKMKSEKEFAEVARTSMRYLARAMVFEPQDVDSEVSSPQLSSENAAIAGQALIISTSLAAKLKPSDSDPAKRSAAGRLLALVLRADIWSNTAIPACDQLALMAAQVLRCMPCDFGFIWRVVRAGLFRNRGFVDAMKSALEARGLIDEEDVRTLQERDLVLVTLSNVMAGALVGQGGAGKDTGLAGSPTEMWRHGPMLPTLDPVEYETWDMQGLPVVKNSYTSAEAYLATYCNLLRYDCLAQFKYSLDQLCRDDWAVLKDCKAYIVMPESVSISNRGGIVHKMLCWRLEVKVEQGKITGAAVTALGPRGLMDGGLVALSLEGMKFDADSLWFASIEAGGVSTVKTEVFDAKATEIELSSAPEFMKDVANGEAKYGGQHIDSVMMLRSLVGPEFHLMVECKVFAKSFVPALQTIKSLMPNEIALIEQITRAEGSDEVLPWTRSLMHEVAAMSSPDESQRSALQAMCKSPLCVVQGPPGTGKSYVGSIYGALLCKWGEAHALEMLRRAKSSSSDDNEDEEDMKTEAPNGVRILVLTYKNRALDDFLTEIIKNIESKEGRVIRMGGRSKDAAIQSLALQEEVMKNRTGKSRFVHGSLQGNFKDEITKLVKAKSTTELLPVEAVLKFATPEQIDNLFLDCPRGDHQKAHAMGNRCWNEGNEEGFRASAAVCISSWVQQATSTPSSPLERALQATRWRQQIRKKKAQQDKNPVDKDVGDDDADSENEEELRQTVMGSRRDVAASNKIVNIRRLYRIPNGVDKAGEDDGRLESLSNLWQLSNERKLKLLTTWLSKACEEAAAGMEEIRESCEEHRTVVDGRAAEERIDVLRGAQVVACTITGAAINFELVRRYKPTVIIAEEAAEILESFIIPALVPGVKQLVLIGDHQQLRPIVNEYQLKKNNRFDISLFERLFVHSSPSLPKCQLRFQSRMAEELAELPRLFYPNYTSSKRISDENRKLHPTLRSRMFWLSKPEYEESRPETGASFINLKEAEDILAVVGRLIREGCSPDSITVLCAYQGQRRYIMKLLGARHPSEKVEEGKPNATPSSRVICHTIDNYQGDENDYVLVSLVRSTRLGFLKERNRLIVSISRGRRGTYFFGSKELLESDKGGWARVIDHLRNKSLVGDEMEYCCPRHSAARLHGDEMCREVCGMKMSCGHVCPKLCHYLKCPTHGLTEKCPSGCLFAFHPPCRVTVEKECKKCDSVYDVVCHESGSTVSKCPEVVSVTPACGHSYVVVCAERDRPRICTKQVTTNCVKCGAEVTTTCEVKRKRPGEIPCKKPCRETLDCGHRCTRMCGQPCMSVKECEYCEADRIARTKAMKEEIAVHIEKTGREAGGVFDEKLLSSDERSGLSRLHRAALPPIGAFVSRQGQLPVVSRLVEIRLSGKAMLNLLEFLKKMEVLVDPKLLVIPYFVEQGTLDSNLLEDPTQAFKGEFISAYEKYEVPEKFEGNVFTFLLCDVQLGRCETLDAFRGSHKPSGSYHSQYSIRDNAYRIWWRTAVKPKWFVEVQFCREGFPPHWRSSEGQLCDVRAPDWLLAALKGKTCCMGGRDGSSGWLSGVKNIEVQRIQNESLWRAYQGFREGLKARAPVELKGICKIQPKMKTFSNKGVENEPLDSTINEFYLFHGTDLAETIVREGFDNRVARSGLYGEGTYFAETICKAGQYTTTQQIIVSRVIMGDCQKAGSSFIGRRPHVNPRTSKPHDSVFGERGVHREYIVFDRSQAMPEYLLTFS